MIYKLGHVKDLKTLSNVDNEILTAMKSYLEVLDHEYGKGRDLDRDLGGYILCCTPGTKIEKVKSHFDYSQNIPEWTKRIDSSPEYHSLLYVLSDDYVVVLIMATEDLPEELCIRR